MNTLELLDSNSTVLDEGRFLKRPSPDTESTPRLARDLPPRPAWVEIDLRQLKRNFQLISQDKSATLQILSR